MKNKAFAKIAHRSGVTKYVTAACAVLLLLFTTRGQAAERQVLRGHVPAVVSRLQPMGNFAGTNHLNLAIGLPLRNQAALTNLLREIYDPASPNYRQYLTPEQFTEQFGPTEKDYQAVIAFAKAHSLSVTATHPNRMLVDVSGSVADIEKAMHVTMRVYQHPTEKRMFHAPDTEPSLDLATPILRISGLDNYSLPRPRLQARQLANGQNASPTNSGSGPGGTYMGKDFRAAYVPDSSLDGSGQIVGLFEFDGYTAGDITYYERLSGLPNVPLTNVLLDGFDGLPTGDGGEVEVSLDIEDAISMAPGLSGVILYEGGPNGIYDDILSQMAEDNLAKQLSSSWYLRGGGADLVADGIFQQMAAQGQSFFDASGDNDAYTGLIDFPGDTPYITQVGGTTLTNSGPGGAWVSETVWNWGYYPNAGAYVGSGGGISTQYPIPSWQTNINMTANHGSTTMRNTPDVALVADNVYVRADGQDYNVGGTSCAAPLWAGFAALVNQQAAATGQPAVGFINPAVYAIGSGANRVNYPSAFHDITTGNNFSGSSPTNFPAVPGYDLCTGWGTPAGQTLINALADPDFLAITPVIGFTAIGGIGGPFTITSQDLSLTNAGTNSLTWTLVNTSLWLNVSLDGGTLTPGGPAAAVTVSLNPAASNLMVGTYSATIWFTNLNSGVGQSRLFTLAIGVPPVITTEPTNQTVMAGGLGTFSVEATGTPPLSFQWQKNGVNLTDGGNISGSTTTNLVLRNAFSYDAGNETVIISNLWGSVTSSIVTLTVVEPIVSQPQNLFVTSGSPASFSVSVFDTMPLSFQWQKNGTNLTDGGNISGSLTTNLLFSSTTPSDAGNYTVIVTCSYGSVTSSVATLSIGLQPVITTEPTNQIVMVGNSAAFSVGVSGTGPFNYQWQLNGTNLPDGIITTAAGEGGFASPATVSDNLAATNAGLNKPFGVAVDAYGNLFIADTDNQVIEKVDTNGLITVVAGGGPGTVIWLTAPGTGTNGCSSAAVAATNISLSFPEGVVVDASGNLFIADCGNQIIRKVDTNGMITTVAGGGSDNPGDGGAATNASLNVPLGVAVDASGNLFFSDYGNNVIRKVDVNGIITTVAGGGDDAFGDGIPATEASLSYPEGVAADVNGNLFIADSGNQIIRKLDPSGILTTVAGIGTNGFAGDGGAATQASLNYPFGVAVDAFGNLFIGDLANWRVRKVDLNGIITTVAGGGTNFPGDGGLAINALIGEPAGVAVDANDNLFIADPTFSRIREVFSSPTLALSNITSNNAGNYTVIVTSPYGSVTSSIVTLTVVPLPTIVSQPQSLYVTPGSPASFSVSVFDTLPLSFQWQKNGTNLTNGKNISGSLTTNLLVHSAKTNDDGSYTVIISCFYGSITSSVASLAVGFAPVITSQPSNQMVLTGGTATFSVAASGAGPFTYQWQLNGTNLPGGIITTVAGNGTDGFSGDGGLATDASLALPEDVALDGYGDLFIADTFNCCIRQVDPYGMIMTVAGIGGTGGGGDLGDGGPATDASLHYPFGVTVDASGNLFIADTDHNRIRKVNLYGIITTVAGNGSYGYSGDGGQATNADLCEPYGAAVDAFGNLFIADTSNDRVRNVSPSGIITTVAGNGIGGFSGDGGPASNASLGGPDRVAVDAYGNLFIADYANNRIRKVNSSGIITTVAGNGSAGYSGDGGPATNASLYYPKGVAVAASGYLFIADLGNNRIRQVDPNGFITTVAGSGPCCGSFGSFSGDGGAPTSAMLSDPSAVAVDASGNLFIADTDNARIREAALYACYPTLTLFNVTSADAGNYTVVITGPDGIVTSSVAALTVASSPVISRAINNSDGSVTLDLLTAPNTRSRVLATASLSPPVFWQPICTNVPGASGAWQFTDVNASKHPVRFYRSSTP